MWKCGLHLHKHNYEDQGVIQNLYQRSDYNYRTNMYLEIPYLIGFKYDIELTQSQYFQ